MRQARCRTIALNGLDGTVVDVEAHLGGMPGFVIVGRPDVGLRECRDRVRAAVLSSGEPWPQQRITANLSPAGVPKHGTQFDLPLAVVVLAAAGELPSTVLPDLVLLGELGLDGRLRATRGVLPAVAAAASGGLSRVVVPEPNAAEARQVPGVEVLGARSLGQVVAVLRGNPVPAVEPISDPALGTAAEGASRSVTPDRGDLSDVVGQPVARRIVEVAAAGRHHVCLVGPPGCGKSMLAARLPGLLPPLSAAQALEVGAIHSLAGVLDPADPVPTTAPYVDPHHTASAASVIGGGSPEVRPGSVSLAHCGVLLLDEAPEFSRRVLEALREPMESGVVVVSRTSGRSRFPAGFQLFLTANPCPCGDFGVPGRQCECAPTQVRRYRQRLSRPLLDRVDLQATVTPARWAAVAVDASLGESTGVVAERVLAARERQGRRLAAMQAPGRLNSDVPTSQVHRWLPLQPEASEVLDDGVRRGLLSARGAARAARVAWTLADLAGASRPGAVHVREAMAYQQGSAAA